MAMDNKKYAKRYIFSLFGLYLFGAVFLFLITFFLSNRNDVNNALTINQVIGIALLFPLLPCASFAGFCTAFGKIRELNRFWIIAICVFFPITLIVITLYGFVMIIPSIIKNIKLLFERSD